MFLFIINGIIIHISIIHVVIIIRISSSSVAAIIVIKVGLFCLNLHEIKTLFPREIWQANYKIRKRQNLKANH